MVDDGQLSNDALEKLVSRVESARGLRAERPIDVRVVTQEGMRDAIAAEVVANRTQDQVADYEAGIVTVGLWPADRELFDDYVDVMGEEVAGLYLPSQSALLVLGDPDVPPSVWLLSALTARDLLLEVSLSHEIVHLLQHQAHPELFESDAIYLDQDDVGMAVQAAFEGDAMLYGMLSISGQLPAPEQLDASFREGLAEPGGALATAPALIRELLGFPYAKGYRLALRERFALLEDPPVSTEQVIHPELRHADFFSFDLQAVADALPPGCEPMTENTVGEEQLSVLFGDLSETPVDPGVWNGWDGDRYLAARCDDRRALLWLTAWDTPEDAEEFAAAYREISPAVARRAGLALPIRVERREREVLVASDDLSSRLDDLVDRAARRRVRTLRELREGWEPETPRSNPDSDPVAAKHRPASSRQGVAARVRVDAGSVGR